MKNARNFYYRLICACLVLAVIGSNTLVFASSPDDIHPFSISYCRKWKRFVSEYYSIQQ